jgi:hypothetical protein
MPRKYKRPAVVEHASSPENNITAIAAPEPELILRISSEKELREAFLAVEQGKNIIERTAEKLKQNSQRFTDIPGVNPRGLRLGQYSMIQYGPEQLEGTKLHMDQDFHTGMQLLNYAWKYFSQMRRQLPSEKRGN